MDFNNQDLIRLSEEEELELWIDYKSTANPVIREKLILKYAPLVKYVAGKVAIGMPKKIEYDDLVGYGIFGLLDAIEKFDPARKTKFKTYAITRIRGAIFDELRSIDWVPRTVRQKAKLLEKTLIELEDTLERTPTDDEVAAAMDMTEKELQKLYLSLSSTTISSFHDPVYNDESGTEKASLANAVEAPTDYNPEMISERSEVKFMIGKIIEELSDKEKQVLILYYYEDLTLKEIGEVLEVTESRVSQLHTKAIFKLKAKLKKLQKKLGKAS